MEKLPKCRIAEARERWQSPAKPPLEDHLA